jgi:glycerol-3-phosphate acyltransferase PlsY
VFFAFALTTRYVSLGSVAAAATLPLFAWLVYRPSAAFLAVVCAVAALAIWAHRSNIAKLARGEEKRFAFKAKAPKGGE